MKKIAVLVDQDFEDSELIQPVEAFLKKGHLVEYLGKENKKVTGKSKDTPINIEKIVQNVSTNDYDALLIPGGYSPDKLRVDEQVVNFVRSFIGSGKPVFTICHGPQLLITADVLKGKRITGYKSIIQDIKNAGAEFIDQEVVEDQNIISSRNPDDLPAFIKSCLDKLS